MTGKESRPIEEFEREGTKQKSQVFYSNVITPGTKCMVVLSIIL